MSNLEMAPMDLRVALRCDDVARAQFERLAPSHVRDYLNWIDSSVRAETRRGRIGRCLDMLRDRGLD
ncbi:MAG: YdeI/OmpD-associated family protein [Micrococcales bacterium]|nr:YdeI/OmpD-associated family protein [Micrococcales bacterium]